MAKKKTAKKKKRPWARGFTPRNKIGVSINFANVPPTLRDSFALACRRNGVSQRNLVLTWMQNYVAGRRPDEGHQVPDEPGSTPGPNTAFT